MGSRLGLSFFLYKLLGEDPVLVPKVIPYGEETG
jgi:hypothetical protein